MRTLVYNTEPVNLYKEPTTNSPIVDVVSVPFHQFIVNEYTSENGGWSRVDNANRGWVFRDKLQIIQDLEAVPSQGTEEIYVPYDNQFYGKVMAGSFEGIEKHPPIVTFNEHDIHQIEQSLGLVFDREKYFKQFNRFYQPYPDNEFETGIGYVFITRPDLNLLDNNGELNENGKKYVTYREMHKMHRIIMASLTNGFDGQHDFIPVLQARAESLDFQDEVLKTIEHSETFTGWKLKYGRNNIDSLTAGSFTIQFTDDDTLSITKLFKIWVDYISLVHRGVLSPKEYYLKNNVIDYMSSVYYFLLKPDGETIIQYNKYTGVFPTNVPISASSWTRDSYKAPKFGINFDFAFHEFMDPRILYEFNSNSDGGGRMYLPIYDKHTGRVGQKSVGAPFIETVNGIHKLRFRDAADMEFRGGSRNPYYYNVD